MPATSADEPNVRRSGSGRETRSIVSDGLGMIQYPIGTCASSDMADHIMGVVVVAWISDIALARWGEPWATGGAIDARFRSHVVAGLDLDIVADHDEGCTKLVVRDAHGQTFATGNARRDAARAPASMFPGRPGQRSPAKPCPADLDGYVFDPIEFDFAADRDLRFAERLTEAAFWSERRWAHPAWLASAANAIIRSNIDFEDGGYWLHAGIDIDLRRPVLDGSRIVAHGRVIELFDRSSHRFAVAAIELEVGSKSVASMRTTFVYGAAPDSSSAP